LKAWISASLDAESLQTNVQAKFPSTHNERMLVSVNWKIHQCVISGINQLVFEIQNE
jgi:hypothetical protein